MSFAKVYPMLIAKAERKGRTRDEVFTVTAWLTGYSRELLEELPNDRVILTGVGEEDTGLLLRDCGEVRRYAHPRLPGSFSGTGDLFAAAFTGAVAAEKGLYESAKSAADFTCRCIECTIAQPAHWYGVKFEPVLPELMRMLGNP